MKNIRSNKAFTLVEVLIVLIIIGVLAGLVYLSAGGADDSAKRAACLSEREKIKSQYAMDQFGTTESFANRIKAVMDAVPQAKPSGDAYVGLCASGGTYTITPGSASIKVACSIHGGEDGEGGEGGGGGGTGSTVVKDNIPSTTIPPIYVWKTKEDVNKTIEDLEKQGKLLSLKYGDTLLIGDTYYIINSSAPITNLTAEIVFDMNNTQFHNDSLIKLLTNTTGDAQDFYASKGQSLGRGAVVSFTKNGVTEYYAHSYNGNNYDETPENSISWIKFNTAN